MAISWYHFLHCSALLEMVQGDCHGPKGSRNETSFRKQPFAFLPIMLAFEMVFYKVYRKFIQIQKMEDTMNMQKKRIGGCL